MTLERAAIDALSASYADVVAALGHEVAQTPGGASGHQGELLLQLAEGHRRLGHTREALSLFSRCLAIWNRRGVPNRVCWSQWGIGATLRVTGRYDAALRWLRRAFTLAASARERRCQAWAFAEMAEVQRILGNRQRALGMHREVLAEFRAQGDLKGVTWALSGAAQIHRLEGCWELSRSEFEQAEAAAANSGDPVALAWGLRGRAELSKERGDLALAKQLATEAWRLFESKGYTLGMAYSERTVTEITMRSGRLDEALAEARQAYGRFQAAGEPRGILFGLKTLADVEASMEFLVQARQHYTHALALSRGCVVVDPRLPETLTGALAALPTRSSILVGS